MFKTTATSLRDRPRRLLTAALLAGSTAAVWAAPPAGTAHADGGGRGPDARPVVVADPASSCAALQGRSIDAAEIGLPTRGAIVQSAALTPAVAGGNPEFCLVRGQVLSFDQAAPPINFQLNLPPPGCDARCSSAAVASTAP